MARILIIDDEKDCLLILQDLLNEAGHQVFPLLRADRIVEQIRSVRPDLIVTDIMMPGVTGGTLYEAIRNEVGPSLPIVISSGVRLRLRVDDPLVAYCPKPVDFTVLQDTVGELLRKAMSAADDSSEAVEHQKADEELPRP